MTTTKAPSVLRAALAAVTICIVTVPVSSRFQYIKVQEYPDTNCTGDPDMVMALPLGLCSGFYDEEVDNFYFLLPQCDDTTETKVWEGPGEDHYDCGGPSSSRWTQPMDTCVADSDGVHSSKRSLHLSTNSLFVHRENITASFARQFMVSGFCFAEEASSSYMYTINNDRSFKYESWNSVFDCSGAADYTENVATIDEGHTYDAHGYQYLQVGDYYVEDCDPPDPEDDDDGDSSTSSASAARQLKIGLVALTFVLANGFDVSRS